MAPSVDELGMFDDPSFHDGYLTGLAVGEGTAELSLRRLSGERYVLKLIGVERFRCDEFLEGNIVGTVWLLSGDRAVHMSALVERSVRRALLDGPPPDAPAEARLAFDRIVAEQVSRLSKAEVELIVLESAYGAQVEAICSSSNLERA